MRTQNLILEVRLIDEVCWVLKIYMLDNNNNNNNNNNDNNNNNNESDELDYNSQTSTNGNKIYKTF